MIRFQDIFSHLRVSEGYFSLSSDYKIFIDIEVDDKRIKFGFFNHNKWRRDNPGIDLNLLLFGYLHPGECCGENEEMFRLKDIRGAEINTRCILEWRGQCMASIRSQCQFISTLLQLMHLHRSRAYFTPLIMKMLDKFSNKETFPVKIKIFVFQCMAGCWWYTLYSPLCSQILSPLCSHMRPFGWLVHLVYPSSKEG